MSFLEFCCWRCCCRNCHLDEYEYVIITTLDVVVVVTNGKCEMELNKAKQNEKKKHENE